MATMTTNAKLNCSVSVYQSLGELTRLALTGRDDYGSWAGKDMHTACEETLAGVDAAQTKRAQELIDKINAKFEDRHRDMIIRNVSGHRVNMGAYVSGNPQNMMKRRRVVSEIAPIKLVIETTVSGGMDGHSIAARGAALAALGVVLTKFRPVEFWACWGLGGGYSSASHSSVGMVRVPSAPFSLSQAIAIMGTEGFARRIAFSEVRTAHKKDYGGWALGSTPTDKKRVEKMREAMGLKEQDVFIPGGHLTERDMIIANPVAWVHKQLEDQRGE